MSEEGRGDGSKLPRHTSRALEKSDKVMQSRLRTDHVLRRKIIIGACVGSFLFLAMLGFGVGLLAAWRQMLGRFYKVLLFSTSMSDLDLADSL
jgi:hypothetical protein